MSKNRAYAQQLKERGYERRIIAFKLCDEVPEKVESYGDAVSFLCAIAAEIWEDGQPPVYITNKNILCGGALYSGIGTNRVTKEVFDGAMSQTIGVQKGSLQEKPSTCPSSAIIASLMPTQRPTQAPLCQYDVPQ